MYVCMYVCMRLDNNSLNLEISKNKSETKIFIRCILYT